MLAACRPAPRPLRLPVCRQCFRSLSSRSGPRQFVEGDVVLLRDKKKPDNDGILTYALKTGGQVRQTAFAGRPITHDEIIGKRARDVIKSTKTSFRLHEPTLEEYVRLSPRIATPIYHDDANVIVGLMDIHVDPPSKENASSPPLEVLEAGTGHGAVTLHLARAIHAANPPLPKVPEAVQPSPDAEDPSEDATYDSPLGELSNEDTFEAWKRKRRAVVHTVEAKRRNMVHARQIVKHFRHGLYARHVDFHLGDVTQWIERRLASMPKPQSSDSSADEPEPFLSRVFLDLPASEDHLPSVARALQVDGILAVFNPSITQIADCLKAIKESRLPLALEHVAELRGGQTARPWEIKLLKEMKTAKNTSAAAAADNVSFQKQLAKANEWNDGVDEAEPKTGEQNPEAPSVEAESAPDSLEGLSIESATSEKWRVVCRPKLTTSNIGGFVGIFRKTSYDGQGQARVSGSETDAAGEVNSSSE